MTKINIKGIMAGAAVAPLTLIASLGFAGMAAALPVTSTTIVGTTASSWDTQWGDVVFGGETLRANGAWAFTGQSSDIWSFTLDLENASNDGARITSWGFNTDPDVTDFTITAPTGWSAKAGQGVVTAEHCAAAGNTCPGGGGGGIDAGSSLSFAFTFKSAEGQLTMDNFLTRWQSVGTNDQDSTVLGANTGGGGVGGIVPLPAALPLILTGMGLLGALGLLKRKTA